MKEVLRQRTFTRAAKLVEKGDQEFSCLALAAVGASLAELRLYTKLYQKGNPYFSVWFRHKTSKANRRARVRALLRTAGVIKRMKEKKNASRIKART